MIASLQTEEKRAVVTIFSVGMTSWVLVMALIMNYRLKSKKQPK